MSDRLLDHGIKFSSQGRPGRWWRLASLSAWVLAAGIACGVSAAPTATQPPATPRSPAAVAAPSSTAGTSPAQSPANTIPSASGAGIPATPPPGPAAGEPPTPTLDIPRLPVRVPMVDTSIHSVPLDKILFDTFGGFPRALPLDRASEKQILDLRDAIVPISSPAYGDSTELPWLEDGALVMGYVSCEKAFAYPINVLNLHEIVNDEIDGVPLLVTY